MWYNTHVSMNGGMYMSRQFVAKVRYSAAYPMGAERVAKGSSLPWGLTPLYLGYCHLNVLEGSVK